jgi:hypothetical protein
MSASVIRIFLCHDVSDNATAADLQRQLALTMQPRQTEFWMRERTATEDHRKKVAVFLEKADLFVVLLSMNVEDDPEVRWEVIQAQAEQRRRTGLQIVTVAARSADTPPHLGWFPTALPPGETIEQHALPRDRQLQRAAQHIRAVWEVAPRRSDPDAILPVLPLIIPDVQERLLAQTDRLNAMPLLELLKRLVGAVPVMRTVLDIENQVTALHERARLGSLPIATFEAEMAPVRTDLQALIERLEEPVMDRFWQQTFTREYFHFIPFQRPEPEPVPFFIPGDDILIPETLNLPVGPREQEALEQIGLLSYEQKTDFRRHLLLCKDALAVGRYAQAYSHCDHVRNHTDPQSAQLYEYLLITFLLKEGAGRILTDAVERSGNLMQYVSLYAGRFREYQRAGKCPSSTGLYNLEIAAEALSDAALRQYQCLPNDYIRHTGHHEGAVDDNRKKIQHILKQTLAINRTVFACEEFLEAAVAEWCGGGKYHWVERVEVTGDNFRCITRENADVEGDANELLTLLDTIEQEGAGKIVKQRATLREDIYYSLLAKRQALQQQIDLDTRRKRPFTDTRESVIRFVSSCLLCTRLFGDEDEDQRDQSFLRLSLEYLMPSLLSTPENVPVLPLRWFTLDAAGAVMTHPEAQRYRFDSKAIVEKIIRDYAGKTGWMAVQPNLHREVFLQFAADNEAQYTLVQKGLSHTDFRRMDVLDARRILIHCMRAWEICYRAYPTEGQDYLDKCLTELSGDGLLLWMRHDPDDLTTEPDSLALGLDARLFLQHLLPLSLHTSEAEMRQRIATNLHRLRVLPAYNNVEAGNEMQRLALIRLFAEAAAGYRLHPNPQFLDWVFRELTEDLKFHWIDINENGHWQPVQVFPADFNPMALLQEVSAQLVSADPERYSGLALRKAIALRRHRALMDRYIREIHEYKTENRRPEREIAIDIIRKMKGIFRFYPEERFLELPMTELTGKGRIRWHADFLGLLPVRENHYENQFYGFNYQYELFEIKRLLQNQYYEMERVMRETGDLK